MSESAFGRGCVIGAASGKGFVGVIRERWGGEREQGSGSREQHEGSERYNRVHLPSLPSPADLFGAM